MNAQKFLRILESEKRSKSGNFRTNLVEFRLEKGRFQFVTQTYTAGAAHLVRLVRLTPYHFSHRTKIISLLMRYSALNPSFSAPIYSFDIRTLATFLEISSILLISNFH